ncbi:flagellar hook-length control protein FliK [Stenotrophomonas maltophilia]
MPAPLASSANTQPQNAGAGATRASRNDGGKDFGQLLQGGAPAPATAANGKSSPTPATPGQAANADGNGQAATERAPDTDALASETPVPAAQPATRSGPSQEKDIAVSTDDAPWPPLGLAGLALAVPVTIDPAAALPSTPTPTLAADGSTAAAASTTVPPALPAAAAATSAGPAAAANAGAPSSQSDDASALPLPEMILPGSKRGDRGDGSDPTAIGDRAAAPLLHAPAPAALQDLKAALATGAAVFNGEPTPRPVLGDDGFDQAIGARLGWLADQKIGHAHIRLSPDDMGPVDVRLQVNGDKVHASFSSPHVEVRQALESSLPRLRELLGEQGFQLAHADVGHQASGGDGHASGRPGAGGMAGDGEPSPGDASVSSAQLIRQRGLLDAYA